MKAYRTELLKRRIDIFYRINGLIQELVRHYRIGLLDKNTAKTTSTMFTKTVGISTNEFIYLVKCLREEIDEYLDSDEESVWSEIKKIAHEITIYVLRVQYFVDALLIEAESLNESIVTKLEFRRVYGKLVGSLVDDLYEWCYELRHEEKSI